ncbi:MAG: presqualene diphosphate synthase HpnD [candidate division NC10 bacterium]|nr:presqualene diphosphate synthase HpnD [candidate division NC10 bacterium]
MAPFARSTAHRLTRASRSNFAYSFLALPRAEREAMYALYAFCRVSDDLVDAAASPEAAAAALKGWREELDRTFAGAPTHPVTREFYPVIRRYALPRPLCEAVVEGVEMDLSRGRYATFADLEAYCARVAVAVGLLCLRIFGAAGAGAERYAHRLGMAFQLTNILRDLRPDAARGRLYLPQEDLRTFGVPERDLLEGQATGPVRDLLRFEAARARAYFREAEAALPPEARRALTAAEIMRAIYSRLLARIETDPARVFRERVALGAPVKLFLALGTAMRCRVG